MKNARPSNEMAAGIGATRFPAKRHQPARTAIKTCAVDGLPAEECRTRRTVWPSLVLEHDGHGYIPAAHRERTEMYERWSGMSESWPVPLTTCT